MSSDGLESEEFENVALVRMEDVQPSRDRIVEPHSPPGGEAHEVFETCIIDNIEFENECLVANDEDSNLGSVVYIQSQQVGEDSETGDIEQVGENSENGELIVPEVLDPPIEVPIQIPVEIITDKVTTPDRWPTLEILPGGVIKRGDKFYDDDMDGDGPERGSGEMVYACAQCSQGFKYLFCLVKHVRWHEDQKKKSRVGNLMAKEQEFVDIKRERNELEQSYKKKKVEVLSRIATAIGRMDKTSNIFK